jgi:putative DNA methylase
MVKERPDLKPYLGKKLTVIAWLWARTVKSPNPAFAKVDVPLVSTFMLSTKAGKEAYVGPVIESGAYRFTVKVGRPKDPKAAKNGTKLTGANFCCVMSGTPIGGNYIKSEGRAGRIGARLMAIVAEGERGRVYISPNDSMESVAGRAAPDWKPDIPFLKEALGFRIGNYGMTTWSHLFTARQLVALTTFSDLVQDACKKAQLDGVAGGMSDANGYANALAVYLSLAVDRMANTLCTIARWTPERQQTVTAFARQAIPMTWDFPDVNPFAGAAGDYSVSLEGVIKGMPSITEPPGFAVQADASTQLTSHSKIVSTDPPYYDNIGYADLSDFFYVWLRRSLKASLPELFTTLAVPKDEELVATPARHGGKEEAEEFFLRGMTRAMGRVAEQAHPSFPVTIYYAFKQSESDGDNGTASTGWETFLDATIRAGFATTGTWPMRTELGNRMRGKDSNALASSVVLVCRPRKPDAPTATRREFVILLKGELPKALAYLQRSNIAPVDLAQAAIGPGMAVFTRFSKVLDAEGSAVSVRDALALINQTLDEALAEQEGDFDADSRWALAWFEQYGFAQGEYGVAETLSKAKNTSVQGMKDAGILDKKSPGGKVRLFKPNELPANWDPSTDTRLSAWEVVHHLIRALESSGEGAAAALVAKLGTRAEIARELAYRLYTLCERKKRAAEALSYNGLVQSWPEVTRLAKESETTQKQGGLFGPVEA